MLSTHPLPFDTHPLRKLPQSRSFVAVSLIEQALSIHDVKFAAQAEELSESSADAHADAEN